MDMAHNANAPNPCFFNLSVILNAVLRMLKN
jgi:hypothetical protein